MPSKLKGIFRSKKSSSQSSPSRSTSEASREPATIGTAPLVLIGEGQNYGVKVLHDDGPTAVVDIVFVHGLMGNAYNTWLHKDREVHWPSQLLRHDISDVRILSFGYDADIVNLWNPASTSRLSNHAEKMVGDLVRRRERTNTQTRKILFVAHSLGGLVVEYALYHSRNVVEEHLRQIERSTTGMIFLGVPHCGADLASSWGRLGTRMASVLKQANIDIVKVLEPGSEMLRVVQSGFHSLLRQRKDEGSTISITCFYEELGVVGIGPVWRSRRVSR
jgi:pimeloyl-ACP methyl ester carboxylesterase